MLELIYQTDELLSITETAINYAVEITNNLLYITDLNSPYRILIEAQVSVYNQFLIRLSEVDDELNRMFLEMMGFSPQLASSSKTTLKFELSQLSADTIFFKRGFPVRASNGVIFITDQILSIPSGSRTGFVEATAITPGGDGNVPPDSITQPLQVISVPFSVTNPGTPKILGIDGESIFDARYRLAETIRRSGLITEDDYIKFVRESYTNAVVSVHSPEPNIIKIWVSHIDEEFTKEEIKTLSDKLQLYKPIALDELTVDSITIIPVYVEVIGSVRQTSESENIANDINNILRNYLLPSNDRQADENTKGIIILNEVERQINESLIDFIQTVKIGLTEETAYGQNFVFDPINQRVKLDELKVILIKNKVTSIYEYKPS